MIITVNQIRTIESKIKNCINIYMKWFWFYHDAQPGTPPIARGRVIHICNPANTESKLIQGLALGEADAGPAFLGKNTKRYMCMYCGAKSGIEVVEWFMNYYAELSS